MSGSTEHRRSPRRDVTEIKKIGSWGNISYHHFLSCGHVEIRPRASRAPKLACAWCLRSEQKEIEMQSFSSPSQVRIQEDRYADDETEIYTIRAGLASRMNVPIEAVDVVVKDINGKLEIQHATVFLSAIEVRRIAGHQQ
jgi:hypothetical protein